MGDPRSGLADILKDALQDRRIHLAFGFGSLAEGKAKSDSDVDLFVIGDVGQRKISEFLSGVSEIVGREINPHVMTPHEFQNRFKSGDHFITTIITSLKLFIIGTRNDFETMGR